MKNTLFFKQSKPLTVTVLGVSILALTLFVIYENEAGLNQIATMACIGLALLGYSISFEIGKEMDNKKHFKLFGITIFKQKLGWNSPDYITVFSALFKQRADWGPVSAMGRQSRTGSFVIRFFKGNKHFTIWKTNSLEQANTSAIELGELLNVEVKSVN